MTDQEPEPMTDSEVNRQLAKIVVLIILLVVSYAICHAEIKSNNPLLDLEWPVAHIYLIQAAIWALGAIFLWPRMWMVGLIAGPVGGVGMLFVGTNFQLPFVMLSFMLALLGAVPGILLYFGLLKLVLRSGLINPFPDTPVQSEPDTEDGEN